MPRRSGARLRCEGRAAIRDREKSATRILFVGQTPETVDVTHPALPPGMDPAKIHAGISVGMTKMIEREWQADACIPPDATGLALLEQHLSTITYDCVVVGAGIRIPPTACRFSRLC